MSEEPVARTTLRDKGGAPWRIQAAWLIEVARTIAALHARGKTRGGLEAEEIAIDDEGKVELVDRSIEGGDAKEDQRAWGRVAVAALVDAPAAVREVVARAAAGEHTSMEAMIEAFGVAEGPVRRRTRLDDDGPSAKKRAPSLALPILAVLFLAGLIVWRIRSASDNASASQGATSANTNANASSNASSGEAIEPAESALTRGAKALESNDAATALEAFDRAARADPNREEAWLGKARALLLLGDAERADRELARCTELLPKSLACWKLLADVDAKLGRCDQVARDIDKARAVDPKITAPRCAK